MKEGKYIWMFFVLLLNLFTSLYSQNEKQAAPEVPAYVLAPPKMDKIYPEFTERIKWI